MNKKYLIVFDENTITRLDSYVIRPCSRSDIINDAMTYLLDYPNIIQSFVEKRNNTMLNIAMRDIPNE